MAQITRPNASTIGNYAVVGAATAHEAVDEVTLNTADYVESPSTPSNQAVRLVLAAVTYPASTATHTFSIVAAKDAAGGGQINLTMELLRTATGSDVVVASVVHPNITESPTTYSLTLTAAQINTIQQADYERTGSGSLVIRVTANQV